MAMDFPARHDRSSLNRRPGMLPCCISTSMISVAAEAAALAGMIVPPRAMYVAFFSQSDFLYINLVEPFRSLRHWEFQGSENELKRKRVL